MPAYKPMYIREKTRADLLQKEVEYLLSKKAEAIIVKKYNDLKNRDKMENNAEKVVVSPKKLTAPPTGPLIKTSVSATKTEKETPKSFAQATAAPKEVVGENRGGDKIEMYKRLGTYTNPKIMTAGQLRVDKNKWFNQNFFLRLPKEDNRWTEKEITNMEDKCNSNKECRFGAVCDRLQCCYGHPANRPRICKDFRWCADPKCKKIHPTQKFCDYIDYTEDDWLIENGFRLE